MSIEALQKAIDIAGGQSALGRKIRRDQRTIWAWLNTTQKVPAEDVLAVENATEGKISRYELRPDIYPRPGANNLTSLRIVGGQQLKGSIPISGAKNAALKLMCAGLLTDQSLHLENMPNTLRDIGSQTALLKHLGCTVDSERDIMAINAGNISTLTAPYDLVRKMRTSILVLGPLLSRFGEAKVSLPGGCAIGTRPIDLHLKALEEMGADITLEKGYIHAKAHAGGLRGANILFPKVSVGATENLLMAATLAKGTTVLSNAAKEPEITNLAECLIKMGAKISGHGTETITIEGVPSLSGAHHRVLADRIETGTYAIAVAMTGGSVTLKNTTTEHLNAVMGYIAQAGVDIDTAGDDVTFSRIHSNPLYGVDIMTEPYPGFPTDMQAQFMAMLSICGGAGLVTETIF